MTTAETQILYWLERWLVAVTMTTEIRDNLVLWWRRSAESDQY